VPLQFYQPRAVKYWNGSSWVVPQDFGNVKMWDGSTWRHVGVRPYADFASASFTPTGGSSAEAPTYLEDIGSNFASITISCTESAVWTHNGGFDASVTSGGSASSITFSLFSLDSEFINIQCSASAAGGAPEYWDIYLETIGN
jgi:hypothetical protein